MRETPPSLDRSKLKLIFRDFFPIVWNTADKFGDCVRKVYTLYNVSADFYCKISIDIENVSVLMIRYLNFFNFMVGLISEVIVVGVE